MIETLTDFGNGGIDLANLEETGARIDLEYKTEEVERPSPHATHHRHVSRNGPETPSLWMKKRLIVADRLESLHFLLCRK
jgi:hypothetical protein